MTKVDYLQLSYNLTFTTPFHCGTGMRAGLIDRTIIRDSDGYLYIPGSTIKGVLREQCERLTYLYDARKPEVDEKEQDLFDNPHNEKLALWAMGRPLTMIARIFGSQNCPGSLFFDDAGQPPLVKEQYNAFENGRIVEGKYKAAQAGLATQVRLHRPTRTSVRGALYTSEFGIKDLTFSSKISGWLECTPIETIENGPTYSLLLLLAGMLLLDRIGGNKSTGKGQCRCEIEKLTYGDKTYPRDDWWTWFDHLDALSHYFDATSRKGGA